MYNSDRLRWRSSSLTHIDYINYINTPAYALVVLTMNAVSEVMQSSWNNSDECIFLGYHNIIIGLAGLEGLSRGVTLHRRLYFHLRPGSRSWPIKFSCLTSWPHRKFGLDPWLSSINHAHWALGEALTVSKLPLIPCLAVWPAQKFCPDSFDPGHGWEYSRLCSVTPLDFCELDYFLLLGCLKPISIW